MSSEGAQIGKAVGIGLATGVSSILAITAILIPVSYVMNRFIYHNVWMRIGMGFVAAAGSVFFFLMMLIGKFFGLFSRVPYFGLTPVIEGGSTGWGWFVDLLLNPLIAAVDPQGYDRAVGTLLVPEAQANDPRYVVQEDLFTRARQLAEIPDQEKWESERSALLSQISQGLAGQE
jgi:hypothetical protein